MPEMPVTNNFAFIDGTNLHLTYENMPWRLDYLKLREYLSKRHNVKKAFYFLGNIDGNHGLFAKLTSFGYEVIKKDAVPFTIPAITCPECEKIIAPSSVKYKCDCDSYITLQVMKETNNYDKAIIITSDGDFDALVQTLITMDKLKLVFAPCRAGCSRLLKNATLGRIAFIDDFRAELEKT